MTHPTKVYKNIVMDEPIPLFVYNPDTLDFELMQQPSLTAGNITIAGTVDVTNWPVDQAVSGPLTDDELRESPVPIQEGAFDTIIDENSATITYIGKAAAGSLPTNSVWLIKRINSGVNPIEMKYAAGSGAFDKRWDFRTTYSY